MTTDRQPAAHSHDDRSDWRRRLQDKIGEDPARYLDADLLMNSDRRELARARIRGIDRIEVVGAWKAAERKLADRDDRDPRSKVLEWLDERKAHLQEHGERPRDLRAALADDHTDVPNHYWPSRGAAQLDTTDDADEDASSQDYPSIRERFDTLVDETALDTTVGDGSSLSDARTTETTEQSGLSGFATDGGQPASSQPSGGDNE